MSEDVVKIKALLVDDEASVRIVLKEILGEIPQIQVVGEAGNVAEAVKVIHKEKPELIFLDIEMPGYTGLQLLDFFNEDEVTFEIIFVTAYDEYAINAFKLAAFDYLLKPVDSEQLNDTLERYLRKKEVSKTSQRLDVLKSAYDEQENINRIAVTSAYGVEFIEIDKLVMLEANSNYTKLYLKNGNEIVASKTLSEFESILESTQVFFRSHRSYLINMHEIVRLNAKDGVFIELKSGQSVPLSRYRRKDFDELYEKIKI